MCSRNIQNSMLASFIVVLSYIQAWSKHVFHILRRQHCDEEFCWFEWYPDHTSRHAAWLQHWGQLTGEFGALGTVQSTGTAGSSTCKIHGQASVARVSYVRSVYMKHAYEDIWIHANLVTWPLVWMCLICDPDRPGAGFFAQKFYWQRHLHAFAIHFFIVHLVSVKLKHFPLQCFQFMSCCRIVNGCKWYIIFIFIFLSWNVRHIGLARWLVCSST